MTLPAGWRVETGADDEVPGAGPLEPLTLRHPEPPVRLVLDLPRPWRPGWYALTLAYDGPGIVDARLVLRFDDGTRLPQLLAKTGRNAFFGIFRPSGPLAGIVVTVSGSAALESPSRLGFRAVPPWEQRRALLRRAFAVLKGDPRSFPWRAARFAVQLQRQGRTSIPPTTEARSPQAAYALWQDRFDEHPEAEEAHHRARVPRLARRPLFTVLAGPDFDTAALDRLGESLIAQHDPDWELLSSAEAQMSGARIRRYDAGAAASGLPLGAALAAARGDYVLMPRPGTALRPHALTVFAAALARFPKAVVVYADEDRSSSADPAGRTNPAFKPAWSPERLESIDYIGDPCCIAISRLRAIAGEPGEAPDARHDLLLRVTGGLAPRQVLHIAQVLSHAAGPVRTGGTSWPAARPRIAFGATQPLVSLIVPTRDRVDLLRMSIGSIRQRTAYAAYEILVVDNGSREDETFRLFESWSGDPAIRVIRDDAPFNYARLNNRAAAEARGTLLGLVNNDVEVETPRWLDEMVGLALRPGIGCVGAKLWYPDRSLQHGGVVTGVAGAAGHRHKRSPPGDRGQLDALVTVNEVSAVTAACLVVRKAVFDEVGGFDEEHFAVAYNDVDFCLRVAAAGYRNLFTPFAELVHHESVSRGRDLSPRTAERFNRESAQLKLRWGNRLLDDPYYSPNLTLDAENGAIRVQ